MMRFGSDLVSRLDEAGKGLRRTRTIVGAALLAAVGLVLNQFTITVSQFLEIGFSFLAAAACAYLYGPWAAAMMGVVTDLAGYLLRPNGAFFPGFTFNELLLGFLYGCWLYRKRVTLGRCFCACLTAVVIFNLFLTPLWLHMMYGQTFLLSGMRLLKNAIKLPLDTFLMFSVLKLAERERGIFSL